MAYNGIEIEIKVKVEVADSLLNFLNGQAVFQSEKQQLDEYFSPVERDFLGVRPVKEWLRLREDGGKCSLDYKNWHYDENGGDGNYCDELETKVDSFVQAKKILLALNFKSIAVVKKLRKIWTYNDYEIAIDQVSGLGDFVEIEYVGQDERVDPKKITQDMVDFLKKIDCGKITRNFAGYPFILLFPDEVKYEMYE